MKQSARSAGAVVVYSRRAVDALCHSLLLLLQGILLTMRILAPSTFSLLSYTTLRSLQSLIDLFQAYRRRPPPPRQADRDCRAASRSPPRTRAARRRSTRRRRGSRWSRRSRSTRRRRAATTTKMKRRRRTRSSSRTTYAPEICWPGSNVPGSGGGDRGGGVRGHLRRGIRLAPQSGTYH